MASTSLIYRFESKLDVQHVQLDALMGNFNVLLWFKGVTVLDRGLLLLVGRLLRFAPQVVTARPVVPRPSVHEISWQGGQVLCALRRCAGLAPHIRGPRRCPAR